MSIKFYFLHMKRPYFTPESEPLWADFETALLAGSDYGTNGDPIGDVDNPDNW